MWEDSSSRQPRVLLYRPFIVAMSSCGATLPRPHMPVPRPHMPVVQVAEFWGNLPKLVPWSSVLKTMVRLTFDTLKTFVNTDVSSKLLQVSPVRFEHRIRYGPSQPRGEPARRHPIVVPTPPKVHNLHKDLRTLVVSLT